MFGSLGGPELILILVVALIVFGPRRLPDIGRSLGKMMVEFRRASTDFKRTIEEEVETEKLSAAMRLDVPATGAGRGTPRDPNATPGDAPAAPGIAPAATDTSAADASAPSSDTGAEKTAGTGDATPREAPASDAPAATTPAPAESTAAASDTPSAAADGDAEPPAGTVARSGAGTAAADSR